MKLTSLTIFTFTLFQCHILFASDATFEVTDYTVEQIIVTSAIPTASTEVTTISVLGNELKREAHRIQNAVQEYYFQGAMGAYLQTKVHSLIKLSGDKLSTDDAVELLVRTSEKYL